MPEFFASSNQLRRVRHWSAVLSLLLVVTVSGCSQTPQEAVLGRWYNGDMSLRFRPNGTVVWNTRQGMAQGKYSFVGDVPRWASDSTTVRVRLDLTRNGQAIQPTLDLQFVGADRIRVIPGAQAVLKRAQSESETATALVTPARQNRATISVREIK